MPSSGMVSVRLMSYLLEYKEADVSTTAQELSMAQDPEYERNTELEGENAGEEKDMAPRK